MIVSKTNPTSELKVVADEFARVEASRRKWGAAAYHSGKHKDDREWHVLGAMCGLMRKAGWNAPSNARKGESPDFECFSDAEGKLQWGCVEVAEVLAPGYRKHEFHTRDARPGAPRFYPVGPPLKDPWEPLRECIAKKVRKKYARSSTLLVHYDIGSGAFDDWGTPFDIRVLRENDKQPFSAPGALLGLLVMNCDMQSLIQLTPSPLVVVPTRAPFADEEE
jgi:hypothetical protein